MRTTVPVAVAFLAGMAVVIAKATPEQRKRLLDSLGAITEIADRDNRVEQYNAFAGK